MKIAEMHAVINIHLECVICCHIFTDPRVLPCGHTFCFKCISNNKNQCPRCRSEWSHPLKKNFVLSNFIDSLPSSMSECALAMRGESHGRVEFLCLTCKPMVALCEICAQGHIRFISNHVVKRINEIEHPDIERYKQEETLLCKKHLRHELSVYCNTCEEFGCEKCYFSFHNEHNYIGIEKMDAQITTKLNESIEALQKNIEEQEKEIHRLRSIEQHFNESRESFEEDINAFKTEVKQRIQNIFKKIINTVDNCHKNVIQLATEKVTADVINLKKFIVDAEKQSQNFQVDLDVCNSHVSLSIDKRLKIVKDKENDKSETSKLLLIV